MTQKEQENFLKNAILIVDHTKTALIALVNLDLQNKSLTFEQFLNKNRHKAYHLCYNRGKCCQCVPSYMLPSVRIIHPAQLELLYDKLSPKLACHGSISRRMTFPPVCCSSAQNGISTNVLDISLARCILTNFCHEVFWYSCLKFKGNSLEDFLNSNKHTIYHLLNNNTNCCMCPSGFVFPCDRPQIIQSEWNNMFSSLLLPCTNDRKRPYKGTTSICSVSATPGICIHHLDLNLQEVLLQYCCPLRKSVTDLADIRNVRYGHVQEARMSDADYKQVFNEIENNLKAIATVCGNILEVKQSLQDLQNRTLDKTLCLQYQNSLLEQLRYVTEIKDNVEICCKEVTSSLGKLGKHVSKKMSKLANEKTVEAIANEVKDLKIRIPRKLDRYYMQSRREQWSVQHSVAKLAKQCKDQSKEVDQKVYSVVESIGDFKTNMDTRLNTVENTVEMMSKNVEELAISIPEKVEKCIDEKGFSKRSTFIGLTMLEIDNHSNENTFVTTSVVSSCVQLLKDNNVLVLTGRAGSGKSRNSLEILRQYKVQGYDVIKLSDLKDFEDSFKVDVETIILCEDIFGRTNNVFTHNSDIEILDRVHACVNLGKTKVIFTIRDIVKRSCKWVFSSYKLFYKSVEVDLCSKELELKLEEKKALFVGYCHVNNFQIVGLNEQENVKDEVILDDKVTVKLNLITLNQVIKTEPILGFPQTCCLFTGNRKFTRLGEAFFKHPSSCLTEEIENLRKSGKEFFSDKIKYSLLVYVLLNGDLLDKNQINSNKMSEIISSCYDYSPNSISEHNLYDAIDEMIGQYLIKGYCTNSYQFQHQTVFESVLISYSRINPELILSKLAFDFIREMVRLEGFQEKEGEIVMKIPVRYYPNLCKRIIHILQNEYCLKSQSLIQLLCDSEIMRENDVTFVEHLIDEAHIVLPLQDLKIIIAFQDESESVNFYLPVALLEHVIKQKNMTKSLFPLLEHTRSIFQNDSKNEIIQSCKASVLSVFVSAVVQEHSEDILSRILSMIKDFKLTRDNDEYFTKVVCSTPPTNKKLMIWLLENIGMEYLDRKALCFEICFRTWTNLLHLLTKDPSTSGIDLTYLIKELCSSGKYDIVKWLVEKINCSLISIDTNINGKKDENIHWLLENVDKSTFNMQTAINELCTSGTIQIVQWFMQNYKLVSVLDMQTVLNEACRAGNICVVTWLIKSTDKSLFDLNQAILAACLSKRNDLITLLVDSLDPLSFDMNILLRMCRNGHSGIVNQLLRIVRHFTLPEVIDCARKACEQDKLEIVQWLIKALNSNNYLKSNSLFDMKKALNIACQSEDKIHILDFLLQNVEHKYFDMKTGIETSIREDNIKSVQMMLKTHTHQSIYTNIALNYACRFNRIDIIKTLLQSVSSTPINIPTVTYVLNKGIEFNRPDIAKHVLDKYDHSLFDMKGIFTEACYNGKFEILGSLISLVDHKLLDMNKAIYAAFDKSPNISLQVIELLVTHIDHSSLDMATIREILHRACRNNEINKIKNLVAHFDNLTLDMKTAMNNAYRYFCSKKSLFSYKNEDLRIMEFLAGAVDNTLLGIDSLMNDACRDENLLVVQWLVENVDNTLFDVKTALDCAIGEDKEDDDDSEFFNFEIIDFLLKSLVTEDVLSYITKMHRLMRVSCFHFNKNIVQLFIEKVDNSLLAIDTVMNRACSIGRLDVVEWLVENVDNTLFDVRTALDCAIGEDKNDDCDYSKFFNIDIIDFLFKRLVTEDVLSYITEMDRLMRVSCFHFNKDIMQLLIEKVDNSLLGIDEVMILAVVYDKLDALKWLTENVDNTLFDVNTALDYVIEGLEEKYFDQDEDDHDFEIINLLLQSCIGEDVLPNLKRLMRVSCFHFNKDTLQLVIEKVDNSLLDVDTLMNRACSYGRLEVVKWLLENVDNTLFDVKTALDCAIGKDKEDDDDDDDDGDDDDDDDGDDDDDDDNDDDFHFGIIDLLLQRFNDEDVLSYITNLKRLMRVSCFHLNKDMIQLLIEKVDSSLLGIDTVMNRACSHGRFELVKWLLENVDNTLFDVKTAFECAIGKVEDDVFGDYDANLVFETIEPLLQRCIDKDVLPYITNLKGLMRVSCFHLNKDMIQLLIEKVDNSLLGVDTVMNEACSHVRFVVVKWILENVDNTLIDVKTALDCAIGVVEDDDFDGDDDNLVKTIEPLLQRCIDKDVLPYITNLKRLMRVSCFHFNKDINQLLIEKVDNSLLGVDTVMNEACSEGMTDVVKWLVEHVDNTFLNFNTAMSNVCSRPDGLDLAMWLLANIDDKEIDMNTSFINACSHGNHDLLKWLLETCERQSFDAKTALNVSCINGHFTAVKYLLKSFDTRHFDLATAIIKVCRSQSKDSVEIGKCLWNKFNHNVFDLAKAMNNACRYGNLDVAEWLFEMTDIDVFDMSEALNSACQCDKDEVVKWIISKIPLEKINVQKAIKHICKNNSDDLSIIEVFVESREELGLDLNILVKAACTYERTDVIEWMLENCDKDSFRILDLLTSLVNIDNSLEINFIDKHEKSKRDSKKQNLILKILKNNTCLSGDYNSILSKACSDGWIDIFKWIITKIDNTELNITDAVNKASQNGRFELINWSLSNLNPDQIDANTLLVEASGFGCIEVVQSISSRQDKCKLNFKNAMNDACEYGRGEVVTWLLENNAKDVFDLSMVMSAACRNGWMDTLNWILENADYMLLNIDYAIIEACAAGNINIVRLLFSTFDKKLFDQQKLSARICEKGCNEKVVLFLLKNLNADVFQMDNILNKASGFGWLEVVSWIMENGPDINTVGSAFENACVNCEIDIVKYLQDKISQENIQTGLQTACKSGFEEIVEVLLDCLNHEQIDIATLLNKACRCGEQTVVEVLLRKIDNALFDKRAAINEACRSKLPEELVYFLIKDLQKNDFDNEVVSKNARKHSWTKVLMQLKMKS